MRISGLQKLTLLDYPGHIACTVFTGGCNFRCPFCHNADLLESGLPSEYSEAEIFAFLEKRRHTLDGVAITGGEPTLQPDLPDFIRKIRDRFGLPVKLDTNGIHPEMVRCLVEEGLIAYVAMDIKASPDHYAALAGVPEGRLHFDRLTETKDLLLEGRVPYEFRTTCVGGLHTEEDFRGIAAYIEGAEKYFLQCYKDSGNILDKQAGFREPTPEELLRYRDLVKPFVKEIGIRGVDIELE